MFAGRVWFGLALLMAVPSSAALHTTGCILTSVDPATYAVIRGVDGRTFYVEDRGAPAAVPGLGAVLGDGAWIYEEANSLDGLQRGGLPLGGCWPTRELCVLTDEDPIQDETCGHGPDTIILAVA